MPSPARYFRLFAAFARFDLAMELSFRANFLIKLLVEVLWLCILVVFYLTLFHYTSQIAGWSRDEYLFFMGCHYALGGLIEAFFLSNCDRFSELVRSGELDVYLLKPIDEQFLITCRTFDWSTAPNMLLGAGIMVFALETMGWPFDPLRLLAFLMLFLCGSAMAYSFLLILTSTSVWLVRNQSLMEMWWLFSTLMRYPRGIFAGSLGRPIGWFFTFIVPALLVINVPAQTMLNKAFDVRYIVLTIVATVVLLFVSRRFFRHALQSYRSASS